MELPSGVVVEDYFVRESRGFCVVFALTPDENVLLVRQYKHGVGEIVTDLPAGVIDAGETPETCAVRELAEETGFTGSAGTVIVLADRAALVVDGRYTVQAGVQSDPAAVSVVKLAEFTPQKPHC